MRRRLRSASLALVVAVASVLPVGPALARGVATVVVEQGAPSAGGEVTMGPTAQVAPTDLVSWSVVNATALRVEVTLDLVSVTTDGVGALVTGPSLGVPLELDTVVLDAGDGATVTVARDDVADHLAAGFALVAGTASGDLLGVVVDGRDAPDDLTVDLRRDDGRLRGRVELTTDRAVLTDLRARLTSWPSRVVADRATANVVVLPPGRAVDLDLAGTAFVGPVDLEVLAGSGPAVEVASARAWIVNRTAVRSAGTVVLVLTMLLIGIGVVRLRRRPPATSDGVAAE